MALSAPVLRKFHGQQDEISPRFAASDTYYQGAILAFNAAGFAAVPTDTAALFIAGIVSGIYADGSRDDAKVFGAGDTHRGILYRGKVWLPLGSAAQTEVGEIVYIADDGTLTQTAGNKTVGFVILDVDIAAGLVLIDLRSYDRIV